MINNAIESKRRANEKKQLESNAARNNKTLKRKRDNTGSNSYTSGASITTAAIDSSKMASLPEKLILEQRHAQAIDPFIENNITHESPYDDYNTPNLNCVKNKKQEQTTTKVISSGVPAAVQIDEIVSTIKTQGLAVIRSTIGEQGISEASYCADLLEQKKCRALSLCGVSWNKAIKVNNN
eukprot:CAMPEP_0194449974 /NCGR_PEP_ID=MMETSP0176-20130528/130456_1 /TAXON_ID=216777 /ORGANISM="Proboscia alata, Strain PI-D3" /LENGTH=180 /DNA_ID=CAMNT_0039277185 /DNA_START=589 /DNA_END=1128 /DNA_ORIENTATION=-